MFLANDSVHFTPAGHQVVADAVAGCLRAATCATEPIVCTPEGAFRCFMGTELDLFVVDNSMLQKGQDPALEVVYKDKFEYGSLNEIATAQ